MSIVTYIYLNRYNLMSIGVFIILILMAIRKIINIKSIEKNGYEIVFGKKIVYNDIRKPEILKTKWLDLVEIIATTIFFGCTLIIFASLKNLS